MIKNNGVKRFKEVREQQKKIYNHKFVICFIILIFIVMIIGIKLKLNGKLCSIVGATTGVIFAAAWKYMRTDKE